MVEHRNRASGWKHAKLSGHINESKVKDMLDTNKEFQAKFLTRVGYSNEKILECSIGGLHEKNVPSVLELKTKSKTDLKVYCSNKKQINISIKKSLGGQVYIVRVNLFFKIFETQFHKQIPNDVKRAMKLFWADADDALSIIKKYADKKDTRNYNLQIRHKSLNATTLKNYDSRLYNAMLKWFIENAYELTKLSFSMGAASNSNEWSEYLWYINTLGEHAIDEIFYIEEICETARCKAKSETFYSKRNGGTTIQLPFGFVQWHQAQMQFHHKYLKVKVLCNR